MKTTVNITPKGIAIETDDMLINIESKASSIEKVTNLFEDILKMETKPNQDVSKVFEKKDALQNPVPVKKTIKNHEPIEAIRKCAVCGNEFQPKNSRSKYCSMQCMRKQSNLKYRGKQIKLPEVKAEAKPEMYDPNTDPMFNTKRVKY